MSSISLRIGGNKMSNEGFRVLVNIGSPSPDIKDMMVIAGLVENEYYFFIRHEADQIVYTVQKSRIRSYGAARDGRLMMAIGVPKGFEVDGASPYDVLMDVYNTFISRYTTDSLGGTQFSNVDADPTVFQEILDRYSLVPAKNRYLLMGPDRASKAFVLLPSARQIADLMRDSQYMEFQPYGEIIVAQEGSMNYPKLTISVPRPVHYKVYVNNTLAKTEITSLTEAYTATADMGECFECAPVKFTLGDPKAGNIPPEVKLDLQKEAVFCTLTPKPKVQTWKLVLEGDHPAFDQVKIRDRRSGAEIPVDAAGQFQLSGNQIASTLEVISGNPGFVKNGLDSKDNVNKVLTAKFMKKAAPAPSATKPSGGAGAMTQNASFRIHPRDFKDSRIDLYLEARQKKLVIRDVHVHRGDAIAEIPLGYFTKKPIRVNAKSEHYDTFEQSSELDLDRERDVVLTLSKKGLLSNGWVKMLLAGLAGLIIGGLIGWLCFSGPKQDDGQIESKPKTEQTNADTTPDKQTPEQAIEKLEHATLALTFKDVDDIVALAKETENEKLKKLADAYGEVVEKIRNGEPLNDSRYGRSGDVGKNLTTEIRAALQATYKGCHNLTEDKPNDYTAEEKKEAAKKYQADKDKFKRFEDLYNIAKEIKHNK